MKAEPERLGQELAEIQVQSRRRAVRYPKALREAVVEAARMGLEAGGAPSVVVRHRRRKYRSRCKGTVQTARGRPS